LTKVNIKRANFIGTRCKRPGAPNQDLSHGCLKPAMALKSVWKSEMAGPQGTDAQHSQSEHPITGARPKMQASFPCDATTD